MMCSKCGKQLQDDYLGDENRKYNKCSDCLVNARPVKVGDVFVYTWGYDQTNVNFFQVVGITPSGKSVKLKAIHGNRKENDLLMQGTTTPKVDSFIENRVVFTKRIYFYEGVPHVSMEHGSCELWDGKPEAWSSYA